MDNASQHERKKRECGMCFFFVGKMETRLNPRKYGCDTLIDQGMNEQINKFGQMKRCV